MKVTKSILSLALLSVLTLSSCASYPMYEVGVWQNNETLTFTDTEKSIESIRVEVKENEQEDFVYSQLDRWAPDGGEYLPDVGLIFYLYVDEELLIDLYPYFNVDGFTYSGTYFYHDGYDLEVQLKFTESTSRKDSYFELTCWLTPYRNNDPYNYDRMSSIRCTPSSVTLYKV